MGLVIVLVGEEEDGVVNTFFAIHQHGLTIGNIQKFCKPSTWHTGPATLNVFR
ncbi:MAG: hypothetical protein LBS86_01185 [Treponema sp.]|jgi:hypothetical protein|nr:hypothetical protein [Treponema sp.]